MAQLLRKKRCRPLKHENGSEHRSEQCIPADLQAQLPLRWQVDLHTHFVVGRHSGLLPCYTTDISFTAFICNSPRGKPRRFP